MGSSYPFYKNRFVICKEKLERKRVCVGERGGGDKRSKKRRGVHTDHWVRLKRNTKDQGAPHFLVESSGEGVRAWQGKRARVGGGDETSQKKSPLVTQRN